MKTQKYIVQSNEDEQKGGFFLMDSADFRFGTSNYTTITSCVFEKGTYRDSVNHHAYRIVSGANGQKYDVFIGDYSARISGGH